MACIPQSIIFILLILLLLKIKLKFTVKARPKHRPRTSTSDWINKTFCYATAKQLAMDLSFSLASRNR